MRRLLSALLGATLLLGACGNDDDGDQSAVTSIPDQTTSSSTSSTTTEPKTVAPDVIPQDESQITEEYVEQVLNKLYEVSLDSFIASRRAGVVDEPSIALIEATNSDAVFEQQVNDLLDLSLNGFAGIRAEPTPVRSKVLAVLDVSQSCVVAEVTTDSAGLLTDAVPSDAGKRSFVRLLTATEVQKSSGLNPTAWVFDEFPVTLDGSRPNLKCEGS